MHERENFVAAIFAEPADDTPRLAYADFLEEAGDAARAELIRVQIAMSKFLVRTEERTEGGVTRVYVLDRAVDYKLEWSALRQRERRLLAEFRLPNCPVCSGVGELEDSQFRDMYSICPRCTGAKTAGGAKASWDRGFIVSVSLPTIWTCDQDLLILRKWREADLAERARIRITCADAAPERSGDTWFWEWPHWAPVMPPHPSVLPTAIYWRMSLSKSLGLRHFADRICATFASEADAEEALNDAMWGTYATADEGRSS